MLMLVLLRYTYGLLVALTCNKSGELATEVGAEGIAKFAELGFGSGADGTLGSEGVHDAGVATLDELKPGDFESADGVHTDAVEVATHTGEDNNDLLLGGERGVNVLLEHLSEALATAKLLLSGGVEVGTELSESLYLTELGEVKLHAARNLLHVLGLGRGSYTRHGKADIDSRALALVEKGGVKENLTVSDRNHVGGNVGRHVTGLGLNDGKGGKRARLVVLVELGSTLEKTRVKVEHISGVGLTAWRTTEEKGHLTVGNSLLGEVVVENHSVHAVVTEELADGGTSVRSQELKRGRVGGSSGNDAGESKGIVLLEDASELSDSGALLADSDVHAVQLVFLGGTGEVGAGLVDKSIKGNRGLASLTVTDDKFTLTTADGNEGVDSLEAGVHGLVHGATRHDAGGLDFHTGTARGVEGTLAVNRLGEAIDHTSHQFTAYRHVHNGSGTLDGRTLKNLSVIAEDHNTDVVGIEVKSHAFNTTVEFNHLTSFAVVEAVHTGNTVTNGKHLTNFIDRDTSAAVVGDALVKDGGKFTSTGKVSGRLLGEGPPHRGSKGLHKHGGV